MEQLAVLTSTRVRPEDKLIFAALERRGIPFMHADERRVVIDFSHRPDLPFTFVLNRIMSYARSFYAARALEAIGVTVLNSGQVIETCGDKIRTTLTLSCAGVPVPRTIVTLSPRSAMRAVEQIGYPAVLKPTAGARGRLLAKVLDRPVAEGVIEHKTALGSPVNSVFYVQEYMHKRGRDIRAIVIGDQVAAATYLRPANKLASAMRGASAGKCQVTPELAKVALDATRAVGGGMLAIDLTESPDGGLAVTEISHAMEFNGLFNGAETEIADGIADYVGDVLRQ
jgi:[lysine-biosynthesis-protein LysW]--L-2-aminoadipate ligase